jgi:hypothetical protein
MFPSLGLIESAWFGSRIHPCLYRLDTLTSSSDLNSDIAVNAPRRSRYSLVMFYFFSLLCVWTFLRVVLMVQFHTAPLTSGDFIRVLFGGLHRDLFVALLYALLVFVCTSTLVCEAMASSVVLERMLRDDLHPDFHARRRVRFF